MISLLLETEVALHAGNPHTWSHFHSWSTVMKPSLSLVLQTPLMNVWITLKQLIQTQRIGFSRTKHILRSGVMANHSMNERQDLISVIYTINRTHCDGEDSDATETPRLCIWRQDLISVIHIEWRLMYDKSFGWLFITRYLSHDIGRQGAFWRTIRWRCLAFNRWANMIVLWERIQIADALS